MVGCGAGVGASGGEELLVVAVLQVDVLVVLLAVVMVAEVVDVAEDVAVVVVAEVVDVVEDVVSTAASTKNSRLSFPTTVHPQRCPSVRLTCSPFPLPQECTSMAVPVSGP